MRTYRFMSDDSADDADYITLIFAFFFCSGNSSENSESFLLIPACKETIVSDFREVLRKNMDQKSADKFFSLISDLVIFLSTVPDEVQ